MVYNETLHDYSYHSVNLKGFIQYVKYCKQYILSALFKVLKKKIKNILNSTFNLTINKTYSKYNTLQYHKKKQAYYR